MAQQQTRRRRGVLAMMAFTLLGGALAAVGNAQAAWPDKPIRVIVPYTPGGATDTATRVVMNKLGDRLKQTIIVENRPGANSNLGAAQAAKADPDGYTFLSILPAYVINAHLYELNYSQDNLVPVVQMADLPLFLFVNKDLPVKTLPELVSYAQAHPDKLTYASSGTGSSAHLTGAEMALRAKLKMTHVAYKGSAPILADLLAGRVSMVFDPILVPMQYVKEGRLRALAFTGKQRWPTEPDIPTMEQAGMPGFVTSSWVGLLAPKGTDPAIIDRMAREISAIVQEPDVRKTYMDAGFLPVGGTPAAFGALMKADSDRYGRVIKDAKITVN
ncbi:putattive exported protein [Bordetella ansorpii]|uniref:Putattive exported protein n=1 Tax=Bordetella ansorpii TaxID=288768 RepID=A0A157KFM7_9BORD|nr:tripartite tricarboxylate transporter substrate binding protein [Bordetella ansorpii]SAH83180.1 putattive exported protein [Bordetella ansorpii]